jgi:uncharacterized membrane protein
VSPSSVWFCAILALISALGHLMPQLTRPDLFFGVTVARSFRSSPPALRILRRYRIALWSITSLAAAFCVVLHVPLVALSIYLLGVAAAQISSHRMASAHATTPGSLIELDLAAPVERIPGGTLALVLPLVVLLGLGYWAVAHLDQLPDRLPLHWSFTGPNRWAMTSAHAVVALVSQYGVACLIPAVLALAVLHGSRRVSTAGAPEGAERRFRQRAVWLLLTVEYLLAVPPMLTLLSAPAWAMPVWSVTVLLIVIGFSVALLRAGQGGSRLAPSGGRSVGDRTRDEHWIGGMIYYNRSDPAVLVEKRMGIGWTVNLGNPWAWALLVLIVAVPALLSRLMR